MNNSECEGVHISVCGSKEKMGEDLLPSSTSMLFFEWLCYVREANRMEASLGTRLDTSVL